MKTTDPPNHTNSPDPQSVRRIFDSISEYYDRINRIISLGRDQAWRDRLVARVGSSPGDSLLDLATGTGDLAIKALEAQPELQVVALDFSSAMITRGRRRRGAEKVLWCGGDALALPFPDHRFDSVVSAYLIRNVVDLPAALAEQWRVIRPGGQIHILDTSPPSGRLAFLVRLYLRFVLPLAGRLIAGNRDAYNYLRLSTENFTSPGDICDLLTKAGFTNVTYEKMMLGAICLHSAKRS